MAAYDRASIYGAFAANAARYPGKAALVFLGNRWSYGRLHEMCERFATALMGFVDDFEAHVDPAARVIELRSASRIGYSDLGVNRKRIEAIRALFEAPPAKPK